MTKAVPQINDLPIIEAEFDESFGIVTLKLSSEDLPSSFYTGDSSASAALFISRGSTDISSDFVPLRISEPANCYIISQNGTYKFPAVKGNSNGLIDAVSSAEVLWESFGTDVTPNVGDLIKSVSYEDGKVIFETADSFKEGNAVIAAKDASGKILWSWHIWLTDQPEEQVYYNNAGTMMDRNLGATSATPGDVGALGLLYQWGRKDPFLGSSSISGPILAKSTITWPSVVPSTSDKGTIEYATANPTTFIKDTTVYKSMNDDWYWYHSGTVSIDNTRWPSSATAKSIYDPCPSGWRVPDWIWDKARASSSSFTYDSINEGINFSGTFGKDQTIWYPVSSCRYSDGSFENDSRYWYALPVTSVRDDPSCLFIFDSYMLRHIGSRAEGNMVRCTREK